MSFINAIQLKTKNSYLVTYYKPKISFVLGSKTLFLLYIFFWIRLIKMIHILAIGITSHNIKQQVPNDIHMSNLFIPPQNLKSQSFLNDIQNWTQNQKIKLNTEKNKMYDFHVY